MSFNMKKTIILLTIVLILLGCRTSPKEGFPELEGKYATFTGEEGWKITYPYNWLVKYPEDNDVGFYAPKTKSEIDAGIGIRILELKKGNIDDLEKEVQKRTQNIERRKFFFKGSEAYEAIYEFPALKSGKKIDIKTLQRYVISKDNLFIITYAAEKTNFDSLKETAEKIMNSFET